MFTIVPSCVELFFRLALQEISKNQGSLHQPAKRRLMPEDVLAFKKVEDTQISPDGSEVAFVIGDSFKSDSKWPKSTIWVVEMTGSNLRWVTAGPRTDSLPRWSPDGERLAFLSDRLKDGQLQIFLIRRHGGEAIALTDLQGAIPSPRGLNALQWSPDGRSLAFLMEDSETEEERRKREGKDDPIEFEQNPKYVRLWIVNVESRAVKCVSPEHLQIWEFAWSPDSLEIVAVVSDRPFEWAWYRNRLVRFCLSGPAETIWKSERQVALPVWSPDGTEIAFISSNWSDRGCVAGDLWVVKVEGGEAQNCSTGIVASLGWFEWTIDGQEMIAIGHERGGTGIWRIDRKTRKQTSLWWREAGVAETHWPRFSRARDGTVALALESADHPRDVWIARAGSDELVWKQLTHLHPQAVEIEVGETSGHEWVGADGWKMQGLLIKPVGYDPSRRYPLVMWVHGGPTGVSGANYYAAKFWNQLFASQGYAVFLPNYRGSVGWGLEFAESNIGGKDFSDMLLGIDSLIEAGIADPERLAVAGWSYGGYIAAWAGSQTDRFRAAVMGAGISHWLSFHGKSSLCQWDAIHHAKSPYESNGRFHKFSPLSYADKLNTPTLILHGEEDQDVPVEQSYLFFRALKDRGVATELIVYPREAHAIMERRHLLDMSRRVLDWLQPYLECETPGR